MSIDPYRAAPFKHVSDMETPIKTARDILRGLAVIAESLEPEVGSAVQTLSWIAEREIEAAENLRCELFRHLHPNRENLEREGSPT